jgi:type 1 glutamine amidotransferase
MSSRALVFSGDQYHPADDVIAGLSDSGFEFALAPDGPITSLDENIDLILIAKMNVNSPQDSTPWADEAASDLVESFVRSGKGLLVVHAGTVGYQGKIRSMSGGTFIHHPHACEVTYAPSEHPLTLNVPEFAVHDEHYFVDFDGQANVFLTSTSASGKQPAGWCKNHGAGRTCTLTPGHFSAVWQDPTFHQLLGNALRWVTFG